MPTKTNTKNLFYSLQIYRGLAALMVVFHHQWTAFEHFYNAENSFLHFIGSLGKHGVDFFFVLSGFIIAYSNYDKDGRIELTKQYLLNRILRIYLPFLPISVMMLLLYSVFPAVSEAERDVSLLTSLTLIPHGAPALSVAWTLIHEIMFYLLFLSWFFSKRLWHYFMTFWVGVIVYLNFISNDPAWLQNPFLKYFGSFYNLEFIIGFLSASLFKKGELPKKYVLIITGIGLFVMTVVLMWNKIQLFASSINLFFAFSFAFIILGSLHSKLDRISAKSIFMVLGNASYSIYLVHNTEISVLVRAFQKLPLKLIAPLVFIIIFALCCITGILYSKFFEEYLLNKAKRRLLYAPAKPMEVAFEVVNQDIRR